MRPCGCVALSYCLFSLLENPALLMINFLILVRWTNYLQKMCKIAGLSKQVYIYIYIYIYSTQNMII